MDGLETERLTLRPLTSDDLQALYEVVVSDPEVAWTRTPGTLEDARRALEHKLAHVRENGFGMLAVIDRESGEFLGYAGLQRLEGGKDTEVGYYLGRSAWGRGLGTELAQALVAAGFERLGLDRIVAVVRPDNEASKRVLAKAGLRYVEHGYHYGATVEVWGLSARHSPLPI